MLGTLDKLITTGHKELEEIMKLAEQTTPLLVDTDWDYNTITYFDASLKDRETLTINTKIRKIGNYISIDILPIDYEIKVDGIVHPEKTLKVVNEKGKELHINIVYLLIGKLKEKIKELKIKRYILKTPFDFDEYKIEVLGMTEEGNSVSIKTEINYLNGYNSHMPNREDGVSIKLKQHLKSLRRHSDKTKLSIYKNIQSLNYPIEILQKEEIVYELLVIAKTHPKITYNIVNALNYIATTNLIQSITNMEVKACVDKGILAIMELAIVNNIKDAMQIKLLVLVSTYLLTVDNRIVLGRGRTSSRNLDILNASLMINLTNLGTRKQFTLERKEMLEMLCLLGKIKEEDGLSKVCYSKFKTVFSRLLEIVEEIGANK